MAQEFVRIKHKTTRQERVVTRGAANILLKSSVNKWSIIEENVDPNAETSSTPTAPAEPEPAASTAAAPSAPAPLKVVVDVKTDNAVKSSDLTEEQILDELRNQFKELTGRDADKRWSEDTLSKKIAEAQEAPALTQASVTPAPEYNEVTKSATETETTDGKA